jgi:DNA-binding NarL/FixJ family response regulator
LGYTGHRRTAAEHPTKSGRLLLAEDHPDVTKALVRLLIPHFDVIVVSEGERLIARAIQLRPDVIVSDVGLEGLDGISAAIEIRRRRPEIPIVLLSGEVDPSTRQRAFAAGARALLDKSEAVEALVPILRTLLHDSDFP